MAIDIVEVKSGSIGLEDFEEFGYRRVTRGELVPGSSPPQYAPVTRWVAFAKYRAGDEELPREHLKNVTVAQAKAATGAQLASTMVAEVAALEGVDEGSV